MAGEGLPLRVHAVSKIPADHDFGHGHGHGHGHEPGTFHGSLRRCADDTMCGGDRTRLVGPMTSEEPGLFTGRS